MTDHENSGIDFTAIDPTMPAEAFERRVGGIRFASSAILKRRSQGRDVFDLVTRWRAPLIAALLLLMLASVAVLRSVSVETGAESGTTSEVAEASSDSISAAALMTGSDAASMDALLGGYSQ